MKLICPVIAARNNGFGRSGRPRNVNRRIKHARRNAEKIGRIPAWADLHKIKRFYQNCPEGMTVDHIIPLKGKSVSGFHVRENLAYMDGKENWDKSNNFTPYREKDGQIEYFSEEDIVKIP